MGTCYNFVCKTCKVNYDIDKYYNARYLVPNLIKLHGNHDVLAYHDNDDDSIEKYEGSIWDKTPTDYKMIDIWDNGKLVDEFRNLPLSWTTEQFFDWFYAQGNSKEGQG